MYVAPQIFTCLYGTGWHTGLLHEPHGLVRCVLASPGSDEGIKCVVLEPALSRRRKARIVRQSCVSKESGESTPVRIRRTANDAPGIMP
jgi:hypothetical protein